MDWTEENVQGELRTPSLLLLPPPFANFKDGESFSYRHFQCANAQTHTHAPQQCVIQQRSKRVRASVACSTRWR